MRDWEVAPSVAEACSWPSVNYQPCTLFILMVDLFYAIDVYSAKHLEAELIQQSLIHKNLKNSRQTGPTLFWTALASRTD